MVNSVMDTQLIEFKSTEQVLKRINVRDRTKFYIEISSLDGGRSFLITDTLHFYSSFNVRSYSQCLLAIQFLSLVSCALDMYLAIYLAE